MTTKLKPVARLDKNASRDEMIDFISKNERFASIQMLVKSAGFKVESLEDANLRQMITNEGGWLPTYLGNETILKDFTVEDIDKKSLSWMVKAELNHQGIEIDDDAAKEYTETKVIFSVFRKASSEYSIDDITQAIVNSVDIVCRTSIESNDGGMVHPSTKDLVLKTN